MASVPNEAAEMAMRKIPVRRFIAVKYTRKKLPRWGVL
jgi:hypothetical protein